MMSNSAMAWVNISNSRSSSEPLEQLINASGAQDGGFARSSILKEIITASAWGASHLPFWIYALCAGRRISTWRVLPALHQIHKSRRKTLPVAVIARRISIVAADVLAVSDSSSPCPPRKLARLAVSMASCRFAPTSLLECHRHARTPSSPSPAATTIITTTLDAASFGHDGARSVPCAATR